MFDPIGYPPADVALPPKFPDGANPVGLSADRFRDFNFKELADATGGFAIDNTNAFDEHFRRIAIHQSNYYLLGFNTSFPGRVGRSVPLRVTVRRPGAVVTTRTNYVSPFAEEKKLYDKPSP